MARPRKVSRTLESLEECNEVMRKLLIAQVDLERTTAERDGAIAAIMQLHEKRIQSLKVKSADLELQLKNYYMTHLKGVEKNGQRSIQLANGVMGRRKGNPALALLNRSWTWHAVLVQLREEYGDAYIKLADPVVDKDKVKTDLSDEDLEEVGLKKKQAERFFAEPFRPDKVEG